MTAKAALPFVPILPDGWSSGGSRRHGHGPRLLVQRFSSTRSPWSRRLRPDVRPSAHRGRVRRCRWLTVCGRPSNGSFPRRNRCVVFGSRSGHLAPARCVIARSGPPSSDRRGSALATLAEVHPRSARSTPISIVALSRGTRCPTESHDAVGCGAIPADLREELGAESVIHNLDVGRWSGGTVQRPASPREQIVFDQRIARSRTVCRVRLTPMCLPRRSCCARW